MLCEFLLDDKLSKLLSPTVHYNLMSGTCMRRWGSATWGHFVPLRLWTQQCYQRRIRSAAVINQQTVSKSIREPEKRDILTYGRWSVSEHITGVRQMFFLTAVQVREFSSQLQNFCCAKKLVVKHQSKFAAMIHNHTVRVKIMFLSTVRTGRLFVHDRARPLVRVVHA